MNNIKKIILIAFYIWMNQITSGQNRIINNHIDNQTELKVQYEQDGIVYTMEAYQSVENKKILTQENNIHGQNSKLEWYSIGHPKLSYLDFNQPWFTMTPKGFYILIDLLTDDQKDAFVKRITSKYGFNVDKSQIIKINPSSVHCQIELDCETGSVINGSAISKITQFPFRVNFQAPYKSKERLCFEMSVARNEEIEINCEIEIDSKMNPKIVDKNLVITANELSQLGIVGELFDNKEFVYICNEQVNILSKKVYDLFDVGHEYNISQELFEGIFTNDFLNQVSENGFEFVPIDDGLEHLSKYGIDNFDKQVIKSDFDSVSEKFSKNLIFSEDELETNISEEMELSDGFRKVSGISISFLDNNYELFKSRPSIDSDLSILNNLLDNFVKFRRYEDPIFKIVPDSIKLAKIFLRKFRKDLLFKRITAKNLNFKIGDSFQLRANVNPSQTYELLHGKYVDSLSLKPIETIRSTLESISSCFKACNQKSSCHYVDLISPGACGLYNKTAFLHLKDSGNLTQRVFRKINFTREVFDGVRLTGHFKGPLKNMQSENLCWEECLKVRECVGITFNYTESDCFLFKKGGYNATMDDDFISIVFFNEFVGGRLSNDNGGDRKKDFLNVKLTNHYSGPISLATQEVCWDRCLKEKGCVAISFQNSYKYCYLFKKNQYSAVANYNYVSIGLESESSYINNKLRQNPGIDYST